MQQEEVTKKALSAIVGIWSIWDLPITGCWQVAQVR